MTAKTKNSILLFILIITKVTAQSESLTSSPYSLYGLGVINQTSIGKVNAMGYSGIGMKSVGYINNLNPASYALIPQNNFLYDLGGKAEINTYANKFNSEKNTSFNFSNLAFAFHITEKMGAGVTLIPYSHVGYSLVGLETNIEGSTETVKTNAQGTGALNDLSFNFGYSPFSNFRIGLNAAVLFGNIEEEESFSLNTSSFLLNEQTSYSGIQLGIATQFDITDDISLGGILKLPSTLNGSLSRSIYKTLDYNSTTVEENIEGNADDFELPLHFGVGFSATLFDKNLLFNVDYQKRYWGKTGQNDHIGEYTDQNIYALGLEYANKSRNTKYFQRIAYRAGFNFDDGYLSVNNNKINSYSITAGLGLPLSARNSSALNISYSYGQKGQINNILIQENYHLITINLSLQDFWFVKRLVK
ncbi:hypothetical protein [Galbibacter sp. PAP.153]|uniref:hypothetical protein n=1 Tax=Galbibacter sp. PAP.153 TaxID=3104623 RepID=UPI00300B3AEB